MALIDLPGVGLRPFLLIIFLFFVNRERSTVNGPKNLFTTLEAIPAAAH